MKYRTIESRLGLLLAAGLLAACSTPTPPAPVVNRGTAATPAPAPAPAPASAPAPAPVAKPKDDAVQVSPARPTGVEVRPLRSTPAPAASAPAPAPSPGLLRVGPKAIKRPYSETALAEMQAADAQGGVATGALSGTVARPAEPAPVAKVEEPKPAAAPDAGAAALTFDWPARGKVLQGFSEPSNLGLTIEGKPGDPVLAAADGKVIFSGPGPRGYGNLLIVKHDADTVSVYAHNKALLVKEGQAVKRSQKIAEIGDTGTDKPNLHFEIRRQGRPIDPAKLLPKR